MTNQGWAETERLLFLHLFEALTTSKTGTFSLFHFTCVAINSAGALAKLDRSVADIKLQCCKCVLYTAYLFRYGY